MATSTIKNPYRMTATKLWENDDATTFSAQTVTIDLSDYVLVMIHFKTHNNSGNIFETVLPTGYEVRAQVWSDPSTFYSRRFTTRQANIQFYAGATNGSVDNTAVVPFRIYGIK